MGLDDLVKKAKDVAGDLTEKGKDLAGDLTEKGKGLADKGFFQKNVPAHYPPSIARVAVPRSRAASGKHPPGRDQQATIYPVIDDPEQLAYLANQGAIELHVPTARAADLGVSTVDIAEAARIATSGDIRQRLAKLNLAERQIPIRVQIAESALSGPSLLASLRVNSKNGPVPLSSVATIREGSGPSTIDRLDRERNVLVTAELNGMPLNTVMSQVNRLPVMRLLPKGTSTREPTASAFFSSSGAR